MPKLRNVQGVEYFQVNEIAVREYHPLPDGQGEPTEVHMCIDIVGFPGEVVCRLKSGRATDELIVALITHRKRVFGDANNERV